MSVACRPPGAPKTSAGDSLTQQAKTTARLIGAGSDNLFAAAAIGQHALAASLLASAPARVHARTPEGKIPLHIAAQWGQLELAQLLLERGADARAVDNDGRTPLHAMTGGATRLDLLDLLIAHGADPNVQDQFGNAPLFLAASLIHREGHDWGAHDWLAEALLKHGAQLDAFTAVILNREAELRALLDADTSLVNVRKRHGYIPDGPTLLHFAADRGHTAAARAVLDHGADVNAVDSRGRGDALAGFLAANPEQLNAPGPFGFTPLNWAVVNGHTGAVADLLDRGAHDTHAWGRSLVAWADQCGQPAVVALLRERGLAE